MLLITAINCEGYVGCLIGKSLNKMNPISGKQQVDVYLAREQTLKYEKFAFNNFSAK